MKTKTKILNWRALLATMGVLALCCAGCGSGSPTSAGPPDDAAATAEVSEAQQVAHSVLGQDAQVLAHGDLAKNGKEQVLAINRARSASAPQANTGAVSITRAAILEKNGDKWREVLLCDENLKNPNGYLGGISRNPAPGWELELGTDVQQREQLRLTPASGNGAGDGAAHSADVPHGSFLVRWNPDAKLYETFDQSTERFLSEFSDQELSPSVLR